MYILMNALLPTTHRPDKQQTCHLVCHFRIPTCRNDQHNVRHSNGPRQPGGRPRCTEKTGNGQHCHERAGSPHGPQFCVRFWVP